MNFNEPPRRPAARGAATGHPLERDAIRRYQRGDIAGAQVACREVLQQTPNNVPMLLLLGGMLSEQGDGAQAMAFIGRAVSLRPDLAEAHFHMGRAAHVAKHLDIAVAAFSRAAQINSALVASHRNLSVVHLEREQVAEALAQARRAVELEPDLAENHILAATVLEKLKRNEQAISALQRAVKLDPSGAEAHNALGRLYQLVHRPGKAVPCHRRAIEIKPDYAIAWSYLAPALQELLSHEEAEAAYRRALELRPELQGAWNGLGTLLRSLGRFDEAIAAFDRAIAIQPDFGMALRNIATCRKAAADATQLAEMETVFADASLDLDARAQVGLGLGKLLDDAGRYDEAFERYSQANALTRRAEINEGKSFNPIAFQGEIERIIQTFTPDFFRARTAWGTETELPVFIVGLFRSGTTLTEQIVASHPQVFGAGELTELRQLVGRLGLGSERAADWSGEVIPRAATAHLARLQHLGGGAVRVIDKNPENVFLLGLIATLYPGARVIFCHRDGRDTALSCFFQGFSRSQSFASDLADCGRRWVGTERLAKHARSLPLRLHEIQYETLVGDLEGESRRLIDFLGLDWDPACLTFHQTERSVKTASMWQVRQPLYSTSVGRWKHYERHIGPLLDVFAAAGTTFQDKSVTKLPE
jgi:tetratricopeptide (TPR) repeat protein